jgi:UDP-3-O-[3-hydroxymyristoyl] N-acetylglucosamine deacetylase
MHAQRKQRTISATVAIEGFGFWSGRDVRVEFRPAEADTGIVFVRRDLPRAPRIPALVAQRVETPRRTTLSAGGGSVEMVEHILAALAGLRIDNCEIWVNEAEMPGCDGSSQPFVAVLEPVGVVEQDALRPLLVVRNVTRLGDDESWVEARPSTTGGMSVKFQLDYGHGNAIGRQAFQLAITPDSFRRELAASRTFMLEEEAHWLLSRGLGQRATHRDLLVFGKDGPIGNELRYRDECVRHKTLDLLGDLALAGCDIVGHVIANRSGHRLNAELVRALLIEEEVVQARRRSA